MPRKTKLTLTVDSDMLARAKKMKIDLSETFEHALRRLGCEDPEVRDARSAKWREENKEATEASNKHLQEHGMWWESLAKPAAKRRQPRKERRTA